jgi:hypothetical protein
LLAYLYLRRIIIQTIWKDVLGTNPEAPFSDKWEIIKLLKKAVGRGESVCETKQHISNITEKLGKHRIYN